MLVTAPLKASYAPVAELADAPDLGSGVFDVKVQVLSGAPIGRRCKIEYGALAQLGAHDTGSVGVRGSSPLCSTKRENRLYSGFLYFWLNHAGFISFIFDGKKTCFTEKVEMKVEMKKPRKSVAFLFTVLRNQACAQGRGICPCSPESRIPSLFCIVMGLTKACKSDILLTKTVSGLDEEEEIPSCPPAVSMSPDILIVEAVLLSLNPSRAGDIFIFVSSWGLTKSAQIGYTISRRTCF